MYKGTLLMKYTFFITLIFINIAIATLLNVEATLFITMIFLLATFFNKSSVKNLTTQLLFGNIFTLAIGLSNYYYLLLLIPIYFLDLLKVSIDLNKEEKDFIWRMNDGPSSLDRLKIISDNNGMTQTLSWKGGKNGYYLDNNNNKYDRSLVKH